MLDAADAPELVEEFGTGYSDGKVILVAESAADWLNVQARLRLQLSAWAELQAQGDAKEMSGYLA